MYYFSKEWLDSLPFSTVLPVRITDVNYGKHLGNDALLGLVHEARMRFLAARGCSEEDCGDGVGLIMRGLQVRFLAQAVYGDVLVCQVGIVKEGRAGFTLGYRFVFEGEERIAAEVETEQLFFDYARQRPVRAPASWEGRGGMTNDEIPQSE